MTDPVSSASILFFLGAALVDFRAPFVVFDRRSSGDLDVLGDLAAPGDLRASGDLGVLGDLRASGDLVALGDLTASDSGASLGSSVTSVILGASSSAD